jgi:DNA invertase Pin-like site-specific DNA recombinase
LLLHADSVDKIELIEGPSSSHLKWVSTTTDPVRYLHQQAVDTTTPAGRALFQMMGVFAEFERAMIRDRVKAGLANAKAKAKAKGVRRGVPRTDAKVIRRIEREKAKGLSMRAIATKLGVGAVHRVLSGEHVSQAGRSPL